MATNVITVLVAVLGSSGLWGLMQHLVDKKVRKRQEVIKEINDKLEKVPTKQDIDVIKQDIVDIKQDIKQLKDDIAHTKDLSLSSARNTLSTLSNRYIELGYIPDDEYVAYKSIGKSYIESGGNTEIRTKYELVMRTLSVKHKDE